MKKIEILDGVKVVTRYFCDGEQGIQVWYFPKEITIDQANKEIYKRVGRTPDNSFHMEGTCSSYSENVKYVRRGPFLCVEESWVHSC